MKTAVLTGSNSGIGKATAMALAEKGYRVIIHGRDESKTKEAAGEILKRNGNKNVYYIVADVSTVAGMKKLADAIKQKTDSIEALVLSTGVILPKHIITADGLELGFVIQYLSRFAVTQLLDAQLRKGRARIVHVGAPTLKNAAIHFDNLALRGEFTMMKAMAQEMLANHLFVQEFAKRNPSNDVVMNIFHVGIAKTGIMRETNFLLRGLVKLFGKSPDKACGNAVYLASDPGVNFSGYFLPKPGTPSVKVKEQFDAAMAEKLWERSMELIEPVM